MLQHSRHYICTVPKGPAMKLKAWLNKERISMTQFARTIDRNCSTVSRICSEEVSPDWVTMDRILLATGGKVKPNDYLKDAG